MWLLECWKVGIHAPQWLRGLAEVRRTYWVLVVAVKVPPKVRSIASQGLQFHCMTRFIPWERLCEAGACVALERDFRLQSPASWRMAHPMGMF